MRMKAGFRSITVGVALLCLLVAVFAIWLFSFGPYRSVVLSENAIAGDSLQVLGPFEDQSAITDEGAWWRRRPQLLSALEAHVYGRLPTGGAARVLQRTPIPPADAGGVEGVEQWEVEIEGVGRFNLVLVLPSRNDRAPVIIMQNFCGNRAAFPGRPAAIAAPRQYYPIPCRNGTFDPPHRAVFGRWMLGPPFERIARRGYALAMFYGGDIVPDHAPDAASALPATGEPDAGALAAWAWMHARVVDVLQHDPRLDQNRMIAWGQSRFGKVALLAAASDERVSAVVALQSGRGGDALTSHRAGESVASITSTYPHWFSPRFRSYATRDPPVDQHQLLALIAPRPLLLGHARRDGWADPVGALAALRGAEPAFDLLGAPRPQFFVRNGGHGVNDADWRATLDFLDRRQSR